MTFLLAALVLARANAFVFAGIAAGAVLLLLLVGLAVLRRALFIAQPNEVLVVSGTPRRTPDGSILPFRIVRGGRVMRIPLLERVDRLDLTAIPVEHDSRDVWTRVGVPITVRWQGAVKIAGEEPLVDRAAERLLDMSRSDIAAIARNLTDISLRRVLLQLTPEEAARDRIVLGHRVVEEAEHELSRLGLVLDRFGVITVADRLGYLEAAGGGGSSAAVRRVPEGV